VVTKKCMRYHKICFNTFKVIVKVKKFHNDDDDDNDKDNVYAADNETRVTTIPRHFCEKQLSQLPKQAMCSYARDALCILMS